MANAGMELLTFRSLVEERQQPDYRYDNPDLHTINNESSRLTIRQQGTFITNCELQGIPVLYSDEDLHVAKLNASHPMLPVGQYADIGGQHGFARWADYSIATAHGLGYLDFSLQSPEGLPHIDRGFELDRSELRIATMVTNGTQRTLETSVGEHLYFHLPDEDAEGLRIESGDGFVLKPEMIEAAMAGKAQFMPEYTGQPLTVTFPGANGKILEISTKTKIFDTAADSEDELPVDAPMGMLLWHRAGTASICMEPTIGYTQDKHGRVKNDLAAIAAGQLLVLDTTIRLC